MVKSNMVQQSKGPRPVFEPVVEQIKQGIISGKYKPGDAIPSERVLSRQFKISRMSVRKAIDTLVQAGYGQETDWAPLSPMKAPAKNRQDSGTNGGTQSLPKIGIDHADHRQEL